MAIVKKISELTPKGSALGNTDLLIVGVDNGTDYDLKSLTGAQVLGNIVSQTITDGITTKAPSENVVFDALALKVDKIAGSRLITSAESTLLGNTSGVNSGDQDLSGYLNGSSTTANLPDSLNKRYVTDANLLSIGRVDTALNDTGTAISFSLPTDYGTSSLPLTASVFTNILGQAIRGVKQKIYHNSATEPTFPITWVKLSGQYIPSTLNIIEAYYSGTSTRVEYSYINDLSLKLNSNTAIIGATKTKITYDSKGLVTSGADATTSDIADSLNKRYVTDANLTTIGNTSGTNTGDQDLSGLMVKANNLSDLTNTTTARSNLGLGSLATQSGTFSGTSSGTNTGDQTFLNARVQTVTSSATVTPLSTNDLVIITAQAVGLTLANPTGTFTEGQALMIRIKDNATARSIAFDTNYRAIGVTLPTTTVISKTMYLGIIYNSTDSKWDIVGYNIQA